MLLQFVEQGLLLYLLAVVRRQKAYSFKRYKAQADKTREKDDRQTSLFQSGVKSPRRVYELVVGGYG